MLRAGETPKVSTVPPTALSPPPTCTFLQPQPKTLRSPMARLMAPHASTDPLPTHTLSEGSAVWPPVLCSLPPGAAGPPTQHLQGTCSAHCQPEGAPRDCLFKLTFWGQKSYFRLFQRQCFHRSLSASAGGRDALPGGAVAGGFVLGCSAQHQLRTIGSSLPPLLPTQCLEPTGPGAGGRKHPWVPTWAQGSGASHPAEELLGGTEQSLGAVLLPWTFPASARYLFHTSW